MNNKNTKKRSKKITVADQIRHHCSQMLKSKRNQIHGLYIINAGEVHSTLNLKQRLPAVCAAIGSNELEKLCNVTRVAIVGPVNGASTTFVFKKENSSGEKYE